MALRERPPESCTGLWPSKGLLMIIFVRICIKEIIAKINGQRKTDTGLSAKAALNLGK